MKYLYVVFALLVSSLSHAEVGLFTEHTMTEVLDAHVDTVQKGYQNNIHRLSPYNGIVGVKLKNKKYEVSSGYSYRRDNDVKEGFGYDYSGVFIKLKYYHCLYDC